MMAPLLFFLKTNMSSSSYPRYYTEFSKMDNDNNRNHNCKIESFFQFYCSMITNQSNNYMARLPAFNQCLSTEYKKKK